MSPPGFPETATPVTPTRQQLDELESLIKQMLGLPVNQLDDGPAASLGVLPPAEAPPAPAGVLAIVEAVAAPAATFDPAPVGTAIIEAPRVRTDAPFATLAPHREPAVVSEPAPWLVSEPAEPVAPVELAPEAPPEDAESAPSPFAELTKPRPTAAPAERPGRGADELVAPDGWFHPLRWVNDAFDACIRPLGPPGRWLTGRWGRHLLGLAGLVLLAGAVAWGVLDWMGWTR